MTLSRRQLLAAVLAMAAIPSTGAFADAEPFPVFASDAKKVPYKYRRREVDYQTNEPAGTIIVDPKDRFLYLVLGSGKAMRYGASVGKAGRTWSGDAVIKKMAK